MSEKPVAQDAPPPGGPPPEPTPAKNIDAYLLAACQSAIPIPPWEFSDKPGYRDGTIFVPPIPTRPILKHLFCHYVLDLAARGGLKGPGVERAVKALTGPTFGADDCSLCTEPQNPLS